MVETDGRRRSQAQGRNVATVFPRGVVFNSNAIRSLGDAAMSGTDPGKTSLRKDHLERNFMLVLLCMVAAEFCALV
jgi:hypothetical protein